MGLFGSQSNGTSSPNNNNNGHSRNNTIITSSPPSSPNANGQKPSSSSRLSRFTSGSKSIDSTSTGGQSNHNTKSTSTSHHSRSNSQNQGPYNHRETLDTYDKKFGKSQPITSEALKAARDGLQRAVAAEKEAEAALQRSRGAVREARQHVENLEAEATREAKLAQAKMKEAKSIRHATSHLGKR